MTTQTIYHIALIVHLTGLTMVAGTTLVDFFIAKQFWKQHANDKSKSLALLDTTSKFPILFGLGFLFLIISGIYMMYVTNGAYGEQIWFRIKFGIIITIILNAIVFGRRQGSKLRKLLSEEAQDAHTTAKLSKVKGNLNVFHLSQLALFLTILTLSIFKFD